MSLLDLNMLGILVQELNDLLAYQISEKMKIPPDKAPQLINVHSCGGEHKITFIGITIWDSHIEKMYEQPTPEKEIEMNSYENFKKFLTTAIRKEVAIISQINI